MILRKKKKVASCQTQNFEVDVNWLSHKGIKSYCLVKKRLNNIYKYVTASQIDLTETA